MKSWREINVEARARGYYTEEEIDAATSSWMTCAIGEQHKLHPLVVHVTKISGRPDDSVLFTLGNSDSFNDWESGKYGFGSAVRDHNFDEADRLLDLIEDRVLELKRQPHDESK